VPGREHDTGLKIPDFETLTGLKEMIPLGAVSGEVRPVIDFLPELPDLSDPITNSRWSTGPAFQVLSRRKMIGMRMGI
jgi:hypothetical protein